MELSTESKTTGQIEKEKRLSLDFLPMADAAPAPENPQPPPKPLTESDLLDNFMMDFGKKKNEVPPEEKKKGENAGDIKPPPEEAKAVPESKKATQEIINEFSLQPSGNVQLKYGLLYVEK